LIYPLLRERSRPRANTKYASVSLLVPMFWRELDGGLEDGRRTKLDADRLTECQEFSIDGGILQFA
jgi:hypothetical protein